MAGERAPPFDDRFTDVPGLRVGHAHDAAVRTGVTVIVPVAPVTMAVDVRGGGPATRETDALAPHTLVERVHALVLSGGSVFGLAAADAVVEALSAAGIGLAAGPLPIPVVPAACLFDLANGGDKAWGGAGGVAPYPDLARAALAAAMAGEGADPSGRHGAGFGAMAGGVPGGIGSTSVTAHGLTVGAIVAVNSFGTVYPGEPPSGDVALPKLAGGLAAQSTLGSLAEQANLGGLAEQQNRGRLAAQPSLGGFAAQPNLGSLAAQSTCIGAVATAAPLIRAQAQRVAMMAHDGLARAIRPIHTPFDGDTLFALSTGEATGVDPVTLALLGTLAADAVARAVRRAVFG